nr:hypothetical protein Iba_chr05fCG6710 [Ipomoea batatas]
MLEAAFSKFGGFKIYLIRRPKQPLSFANVVLLTRILLYQLQIEMDGKGFIRRERLQSQDPPPPPIAKVVLNTALQVLVEQEYLLDLYCNLGDVDL